MGPWNRLTIAFAAAFLVSAIALGVVWSLAPNELPPTPTRRFVVTLPADGVLRGGTVQPLAISSDGRALIMNMATVESEEFLSQLFIRPLESLGEARVEAERTVRVHNGVVSRKTVVYCVTLAGAFEQSGNVGDKSV